MAGSCDYEEPLLEAAGRELAKRGRVVGDRDLVEVSPDHDRSGITAILAAQLFAQCHRSRDARALRRGGGGLVSDRKPPYAAVQDRTGESASRPAPKEQPPPGNSSGQKDRSIDRTLERGAQVRVRRRDNVLRRKDRGGRRARGHVDPVRTQPGGKSPGERYDAMTDDALRRTPLHDLHAGAGRPDGRALRATTCR